MGRADYGRVVWDAGVEEDCRRLVRLAVWEDLRGQGDLTTLALVEPGQRGTAQLVARERFIVAGLPAVQVILDEMQAKLSFHPWRVEGAWCGDGARLGELAGSARDLLTCERLVLNFLGRMSGVATFARALVEAAADAQSPGEVAGPRRGALVYDTRKTTPGWRLLEKYAVAVGGACNHRQGLYDAVLIKDNHLALWGSGKRQGATGGAGDRSAAGAVHRAREFLRQSSDAQEVPQVVEIEVDTLEQLRDVLSADPDVVLLDNMSVADLRRAAAIRDATSPGVVLEASGGVTLENICEIAATGVERISVGAMTHSARSVDIALDWL